MNFIFPRGIHRGIFVQIHCKHGDISYALFRFSEQEKWILDNPTPCNICQSERKSLPHTSIQLHATYKTIEFGLFTDDNGIWTANDLDFSKLGIGLKQASPHDKSTVISKKMLKVSHLE